MKPGSHAFAAVIDDTPASRRAKAGSSRNELIANGTVDTFESAKAAALFEATARSSE